MSNERPVVFISSTIYDFKDLRSALKYWLEEFGYEVLLSESNDFRKPIELNSFDACFNAIQRANYYVLLIGSRVGNYYDAPQKISVTRREYQVAYELAKVGHLKIVSFVRDELWKIREDRQALKTYLQNELALQNEIGDEKVNELINYPSQFVNDAQVIFEFIDEVSRTEETNQAISGKTHLPVANWVHTFSTFRDIVEVLRVEFKLSSDLKKKALITSLKQEIFSNLAVIARKHDGKLYLPFGWFVSPIREYLNDDIKSSSLIPGEYLRLLVIYLATPTRVQRLSVDFIKQALISGVFLEYDFEVGIYKDGIIHDALLHLNNYIKQLGGYLDGFDKFKEDFFKRYASHSNYDNENVSIDNLHLLLPLGLANIEENIANLSISIIKALNGSPDMLLNLKLMPPSPFASAAQGIRNETVTIDEVINWVDEQ